jgi:hypothetical protein
VNLFVQLARGDDPVHEAMGTRVVLQGMLFALDELSHLPSVLLKLLHVVCRLTMCAAAWEALEEADAIGTLYFRASLSLFCLFPKFLPSQPLRLMFWFLHGIHLRSIGCADESRAGRPLCL